MGGGLGIPYRPEQSVVDVPGLVVRMRKVFDAKIAEHSMPEPVLHMENGRYMTGPFGWLVARCHAVKRSYATYYGLDACMSNLMRPGMYGSYHHITVPARDPSACDVNASPPEGDDTALANVVGTLCENNDWFAKDRALPKDAQVGDLFVIHETGAHSHSMGFQYNGKLRAPELLLRGDGRRATAKVKVELIRKRETIESLFENCVMPEGMN